MKLFGKLIKHVVRRLRRLIYFMFCPCSYIVGKSYYPEEKRKPFIRLYCEFLWDIIKYGHIDFFYFSQGLDRANLNRDDYMQYDDFLKLRAKANRMRSEYNYICLLRDKSLFATLAQAWGLPTPIIIGQYCDGNIKASDGRDVPLEELLNDHPSVFCKTIDGLCGENACTVDKKGGKYFFDDCEMSIDEIKRKLCDGGNRYIVQDRLVQHRDLKKLYPNSLNTMRVVSVCTSDKIEILGAVLRVGANGSVVDNWAHGGLAVGVQSNGCLREFGIFKPGRGTKAAIHPNSGVKFSSFRVPCYDDAIALVVKAHKKFHFIKAIGWDIAILDNNQLMIIEGNDNFDGAIAQCCNGGLRERYTRFFNEL